VANRFESEKRMGTLPGPPPDSSLLLLKWARPTIEADRSNLHQGGTQAENDRELLWRGRVRTAHMAWEHP
jgi:hypothetical protein